MYRNSLNGVSIVVFGDSMLCIRVCGRGLAFVGGVVVWLFGVVVVVCVIAVLGFRT